MRWEGKIFKKFFAFLPKDIFALLFREKGRERKKH